MKKEAIDRFFENLILLQNGTEIDLYSSSIDATFERICGALLKEQRGNKIWYDGTADLTYEVDADRNLAFKGSMNVMEGQSNHWIEPFIAEITMASSPAQCDVTVACGEYSSTGNLYQTFGYS